MKTSVPILIGVWVLWVGVCSVLHWNLCCNGIAASKALHISDGNAKVVQAEEGIKFELALLGPIIRNMPLTSTMGVQCIWLEIP